VHKILIVGPYRDGNDISLHRAEVGIHKAFMQLGYETWLYDHRKGDVWYNDQIIISSSDAWEPDFLIKAGVTNFDLVLAVGPGLPDNIIHSKWWESLSGLKCLWTSEPVRLKSYFDRMATQKDSFDMFFTFDESEIPIFTKELGILNIHWIPQAYNPDWYYPIEVQNKMDYCFCGSIGGKWSSREHFLSLVAS